MTPPFVDAHFHMDSTLSYGLPRVNASGTLLEGIALWGELKPTLTTDAIVERALAYCDWAVGKGLLAIRSHVDVCDPRLMAVDALLDVRKRVAPYLDLQLVAFPQDGLLRSEGAHDNLVRALDKGVDVVGGIPHFERTMAEGAESVRILCEIAAARGLRVDMHCDETDDPMSRHIESLDAGNAPARPLRPRRGLASHLDAFDGQLLRVEADSADRGSRRGGDRESADQHHDPGAARHLPQAPRDDARAGADGGGHRRRARPRLRARPVVSAGLGRHARSRAHGSARRADDRAAGDGARASTPSPPFRRRSSVSKGTALRRDATPTSCCWKRAIRSRRYGSRRRGSRSCAGAASSRARRPLPRRSTSRADRLRPATGPGSEGARVSLSVIVIAKDEEASIARTLDSVAFADEIVVVDSGSTDRTVDIARELGAKVTVTRGLARIRAAEESRARSRHRRLGALARCRRVADRRIRRRRYGGSWVRTRPRSPPTGCRDDRASAGASCATRAGGRITSCDCFAAARARFSDDAVHERVIVDGKVATLCASRSCTRRSSTSRISSTR